MRAITCRQCRQRPKDERQRILATDEIYGFLDQSNISQTNIERLEQLSSIDDSTFQKLRTMVLEIAILSPRKRKRWAKLREKNLELFQRIVESSLFDHVLDEQDDDWY